MLCGTGSGGTKKVSGHDQICIRAADTPLCLLCDPAGSHIADFAADSGQTEVTLRLLLLETVEGCIDSELFGTDQHLADRRIGRLVNLILLGLKGFPVCGHGLHVITDEGVFVLFMHGSVVVPGVDMPFVCVLFVRMFPVRSVYMSFVRMSSVCVPFVCVPFVCMLFVRMPISRTFAVFTVFFYLAVGTVNLLRIVRRCLQCYGRNSVFVKADQISMAVDVFCHVTASRCCNIQIVYSFRV
jgi:hypothetical protein